MGIAVGNTETFLGRQQVPKVRSRLSSSTPKKQLGICIDYTYISELTLRIHRGNLVSVK